MFLIIEGICNRASAKVWAFGHGEGKLPEKNKKQKLD